MPLDRVASGGELSRLQLAVQSVAAARGGRRRTLVFDEVDSGIGGRTAESVGKKLRALARGGQVLCVTHVPQIAALADRHFLAEKKERKGRTIAAVRLLEGRERGEALRRACVAGALAASRFGAQTSLPTADEVDALL